MANSKVHGGSPLVWLDSLGPVLATGGGAAAPSLADLSGSGASAVRTLAFTASTEDRAHCAFQFNHNIYIPSAGTITLKPHCHCSFLSEPAAGATVIWEVSYVYAKIGLTAEAAGQYAASPEVITGTYTVPDAPVPVHTRKNILIPINSAAVTIAVADASISMSLVATIRLKSTSTIGAGIVTLEHFDWHYQCGPHGTDTEFA